MICGKTLGDGISNVISRDMTGVENIDKFFKQQRLRWFEHVERMDDEKAPAKTKKNCS